LSGVRIEDRRLHERGLIRVEFVADLAGMRIREPERCRQPGRGQRVWRQDQGAVGRDRLRVAGGRNRRRKGGDQHRNSVHEGISSAGALEGN
jgi:hypothetical protein